MADIAQASVLQINCDNYFQVFHFSWFSTYILEYVRIIFSQKNPASPLSYTF